jgi:hypothetical protein
MPFVFIEDPREFIQRHSKDGPPVRTGRYKNRTVFADGALLIDKGHPKLLAMVEPPTDAVAKLRLRGEYVSLRLEEEVNAFNKFKTQCRQQIAFSKRWRNHPGPGLDDTSQLKAGQKRIAALREELEEINHKLTQTPEAIKQREHEQRHAEMQSKITTLANEIESIQI